MGTSYLKALQLQKKLEEQAKTEAENRGKAEEFLGKIDSLLSEYKKAGLDVSSAEDARKQAKENMAAKEHTKALTELENISKTLETMKEEQLEQMISSSEDMILLSKTLGATTKKAEDLIGKARKSIESGEPLENIVKIVKDAWNEAEKTLQERISGTFSAAQSLLRRAKEIGEETEAGETLFKEAREAVDSGDYREALEKLSECVDIIGSKVAGSLSASKDEIQAMLDIAENMKIDVAKFKDELAHIEKLLNDSEYEEALKTTNLLRENVGKVISDSLGQLVKETESSLRVAKKIDADVKDIEAKLSEGKKCLFAKEYTNAGEILSSCKEELGVSCFQSVLKIISNSRGKFLTAKKLGMDLSKSIDLLNQARDALKDSQYENAINFALRSDTEIEGRIGQFKKTEESLHLVEENIATAEELGIDTAFSQQLVSEARGALESNDFSKALDLINKSKEKIENAEYMKIEEAVEQAQIAITLAEKLGVDVRESASLVESAIVHLKNKNFKDSLSLSRKVRDDMTGLAKKRILEVIEAGRIFLNENAFDDSAEAVELLNKAEGAVGEELLEEAFKFTEKSNEVVANLQEDRCKKILGDVERGISFLEKNDIDVSGMLPSFNRASSLLKDGDYSNAAEAARDCMEKLSEAQKEAFEDVFSSAKLSAVEARRKGINIDAPKKALEESKDFFAHGRYEEAIVASLESKRISEELKEKFSTAYSSIMECAGLITETKKEGVDVKSVAKALMQAKKSLETQDYDKAVSISKACKDNLERTRSQYKVAKSMVIAQSLVTTASNIELDVSSQSGNLEKAKKMMKERQFQESLQTIESCVSELEGMVEKHLLNVITSAESAMDSAKGVGIDVKGIEDMIVKSKERMNEREYESSYTFAKDANSTIEQLREISQKAVLRLQEAKSSISNALNVGADVTTAKMLMEQAVQDIKDNKYKNAIAKAEQVKETVEAAQKKRVGDMLSSIEASIQEAKKSMNTSRSEELLSSAKKLLEEKKYKEALNMAMQCEGNMKNITLQHKMAEESIIAARAKIEEMEKDGIPGGDAKKTLEKAEQAFSSNDYVQVLSLAVEAGEMAHTVKETYLATKEVLLQAVNRMKALREQGVDVKSAEAILSGASAEFKSQEYGKAKEYAKEAVAEAEKKYHSFVASRVEDAKKDFAKLESMGGNVERAVSIMKDAKAALDAKEYTKVFALLDKVKIVINYEIKGAVRKKISIVEAAVDEAKEKGLDVAEASTMIHEAIMGAEGGEFQKALDMAEKAQGILSSTTVEKKELNDILLTTESLMAKAKKFGLDVKNAKKMYDDAVALKEEDIMQSLSLAETAREETQRIMDELAPRISAKINAGTIYKGEWTTVEFVLMNTGRSIAKNVRPKIVGVETKGLKEAQGIIGGKSETYTIQVMVPASGEIELKVNGEYESMVEKKTISMDQTLTLAVNEKLTFKRTKAMESGKCNQCHSAIKKDMDIVLCDCGLMYHGGICSKKKITCDCGRSLVECGK